MVQRIAKVTVQQDKFPGAAGDQNLPSGAVPSPEPAASSDASRLRCPVQKCEGWLKGSAADYDSRTGLESLVCTQCGHRGFRSREGVLLLFRGGLEFKFSYGPSLQTVTVVLSSASVNLWGTHGVNEDQLAKIAAEWALLCGNKIQRVHLGLPAEELADFYLYFCRK